MGSLKKRGSIWWIKYYRGGIPHEESSRSRKKSTAADLLKVREGDIAKGIPVSARNARLRFEDATADVVNDYKVNGRSSIDGVERRIRLHLTPFFGGRRMSSIDTPLIRTYVTERQVAVQEDDGTTRRGASNAEINRELAILKRAFRLSMQAGRLLHAPHIPMLVERNVRQGFFERGQFEAVRAHLPEPWRPVMTFAYITGWRVRSEILPLTWSQVDTTQKIVRLDPDTTKNNEGRTFPYDGHPELKQVMRDQQVVRQALRDAGTITPLLFPSAEGDPLPRYHKKLFDRACRAAGWPGKVPHDFRRTAVRNLVRAGVPEKTAMLLTGHKTRSVFDRYDIVNEEDLRGAVARLGAATGTIKGQSKEQGRVRRFQRRRK